MSDIKKLIVEDYNKKSVFPYKDGVVEYFEDNTIIEYDDMDSCLNSAYKLIFALMEIINNNNDTHLKDNLLDCYRLAIIQFENIFLINMERLGKNET